uniref:Peptidase A2 domain-containing protein n=1 Tax=Panagrolaimus superbus TaxID=310955 RepID=A0A914Z3W3_9BILA
MTARRRSKSGAPINVVELEPINRKNSFSYIPPVYHVNYSDGKLPYIDVKINGQNAEALIDSGAAISIISQQMMERLNVRIRRMEKNGKAANGSTVHFIGKTTVEIQISSRTKIKAEVAMAQKGHCPTDIIIGHDLCKQMEAQFDFKAKKINLLGETIPINVLLEEEIVKKSSKEIKL